MTTPVLEPPACICTPYRDRDVHDADCPQLRNDIPRMTMHDALSAFEAIRSSTRVGEAAHGIATLAIQQIKAHGGDGVPAPAVPADQRPAREVVHGAMQGALDDGVWPGAVSNCVIFKVGHDAVCDRLTAMLESDRAARQPREGGVSVVCDKCLREPATTSWPTGEGWSMRLCAQCADAPPRHSVTGEGDCKASCNGCRWRRDRGLAPDWEPAAAPLPEKEPPR